MKRTKVTGHLSTAFYGSLLLSAWLMFFAGCAANPTYVGDWTATMSVKLFSDKPAQIPITMHVTHDNGSYSATLIGGPKTMPQAVKLAVDIDDVTMEAIDPIKHLPTIVFKGKSNPDATKITGDVVGGSDRIPIEFTKQR